MLWFHPRGSGMPHPRELAWVVLLSAIGLLVPRGSGQLPALCAQNATRRDAICCPIPPGYWEMCGGYPRGRCAPIPDNNEDYSRAAKETMNDDRFHWPLRFFQYGCECYGNFAGYMCHECRYGYTGKECSERIVRVRKDFKKLNSTDKRYILDLFEKSRTTESDYVLIDVSKGADPVENISLAKASVFDYLAYVHYYASRKTVFRSTSYPGNQTDFRCDEPHFSSLDFAHRGSNFPIWHRYYMILWETEMQKLSGDIQFTFPYWNWTDAGVRCDICTDDFIGREDFSGRILAASPVSHWYGLCVRQTGQCEACDPNRRYPLTRIPGRVTGAPALPTADTVNFALLQNVFDFPDYTTSIPNASFRGCLEGYVGIPKRDVYRLHNEVHMFFGGLLNSATSASWDPIFYFHHSFMDKLLEMWLRRTGAEPTQLPLTGSAPGHHRNSFLMAFFPIQEAALYFRPSESLGYTYDDMIRSTSEIGEATSKGDVTSTVPVTSSPTEIPQSQVHELVHDSPHHDHDHDHEHRHEGTYDVTVAASLMQLVAVETALLVVLILVLVSTCGFIVSRKSRGYTRVPSHDYYENGDCPSVSSNEKNSQETDSFSDSEFNNLKV